MKKLTVHSLIGIVIGIALASMVDGVIGYVYYYLTLTKEHSTNHAIVVGGFYFLLMIVLGSAYCFYYNNFTEGIKKDSRNTVIGFLKLYQIVSGCVMIWMYYTHLRLDITPHFIFGSVALLGIIMKIKFSYTGMNLALKGERLDKDKYTRDYINNTFSKVFGQPRKEK